MRLVTMCGSLSADSANRMALDCAVRWLREPGAVDLADIEIVDVAIEAVPMFSPEAVDHPPDAVGAMRSALETADGVLLAAPEYAGGLAGGVKNALDWLVGSGSIYGRPIAVLSAGTTGGTFAIEQLVRTLSWQGALTVATLGISSPRTKMQAGFGFVDPTTVAAIEQWVETLATSAAMEPAALLRHVAGVVRPFGIDPTRFGDLH